MSTFGYHTTKHMLSLTRDQQDALVSIIDHWYLYAKNNMVPFGQTHNLGRYKEELKNLVCWYDYIYDDCEFWQRRWTDIKETT